MNLDDLNKYAYKKKESILKKYINDIKTLLDNGATQNSIIEYLKDKKGEKTTQSNLSKFIKRYIKKEPYKPPVKNEKNLSPNEGNRTKKEDSQPKPKKKSLYLLD
ncbi:MAG TPA: hypothetical protein ENK99_04450 [Campylobacterales bacterium]|nr:hypothetical protein [Campylobacterales bacterium]